MTDGGGGNDGWGGGNDKGGAAGMTDEMAHPDFEMSGAGSAFRSAVSPDSWTRHTILFALIQP